MNNADNSMSYKIPYAMKKWRGLAGWNYYFLAKFGLMWFGYLNLDAFLNLVFVMVLIFPVRSARLNSIRLIITIPIGFFLLWHDTWLPGFHTLMGNGNNVKEFSFGYMIELVNRFINIKMIGALFVLFVVWLFMSQWLRFTTFIVSAILWINVFPVYSQHTMSKIINENGDNIVTDNILKEKYNNPRTEDGSVEKWVKQFYSNESDRTTQFPQNLPSDSQPFDILIINICSLSWGDLDFSGLRDHPIWSHLDIIFDQFNTASSYSGPAAIRLLRASCGQTSHELLYHKTSSKCYLFDNLSRLGFKKELLLDHPGIFNNYEDNLTKYGNLGVKKINQDGLKFDLQSFFGTPVYNTDMLLNRWLDYRIHDESKRTSTFINLIPLHDGNRIIGQTRTADYKLRATKMLTQLDEFLKRLDKSGRKTMVVLIPEHGAALEGDKVQISGLRDIPSAGITHVPVGIVFTGLKAPHLMTPIVIKQPSSYLAVSEIISRAVSGKEFVQHDIDWASFTQDLPETQAVSENENNSVINYNGKYWLKQAGGNWIPFPQ